METNEAVLGVDDAFFGVDGAFPDADEQIFFERLVFAFSDSLFLFDIDRDNREEKGCVDACLCFLDSRAGQWPTATALCLLRLGLECTSSRARARPSMDTVSTADT